jgi:hypothetical protein
MADGIPWLELVALDPLLTLGGAKRELCLEVRSIRGGRLSVAGVDWDA